MIDERTTELLVERLIERVNKANTYFLKKMGASIKQIKDLSPTQAQQLIQILKYGGNYEETINELSKYTEMNVKEIEDIFNNYAKKDQYFYKKFYEYKDIPFTPFDENTALKMQTTALSNIATNEMYNFSRTNVLGYTINDEFFTLRETYNKLLDTAMLNVGQGKETFDSAMYRILKDIGASGLTTLNYESGRNVRLDSAIRMHLKSRLRELHNENQLIIGEEIGADGVEISVHSNPAPDHAEAQGRQFTNEEYQKLQAGLTAKDYKGRPVMIDHSKKGGYRPISEMNCYHYIFSIVLGVSEPEYNEEQLEEINRRNNEGFEFDGKHYTNYEGTQLQRALERKIREQKDIQILGKESDNDLLIDKAQQKITQLTKKYKELSDVSGLPTKMERMRVSGYRRTAIDINNNLQRNTKNIIAYKNNKDSKINYLGRIDLKNDDLVNNRINDYRKSILWDAKENAYLIDKNGDIFNVVGNKNNVKIPEWLDQKNGIVMHNHPPNVTNYSFGEDDIREFLSKGYKKLYGDDTSFQYLIERNKDTTNNIDDLSTDWEKYSLEARDLSMNGKLNIDIDEYDYIVDKLSKIYNFKYKRRKQNL